jgi:LSD1 subclass zinc finger protein
MRVNGCEVLAGLRVLADRDEIRTDDGIQCFFSTETLAVIEAFPGADREVFCGRCRQPIKTGASAVRCPGCQIWYHQDDSESLPCWTYTDKCNFCPNPTALDSGFMWIPED